MPEKPENMLIQHRVPAARRVEKEVPKWRSNSSIVTAPASTGITASSRKAVTRPGHANNGLFLQLLPGARIFKMVTTILIAPIIDDAPMIWIAKISKSIPGPIWVDKGAYIVQPDAGAPP